MNILIINQNTENYGDDIAAIALYDILKNVSQSPINIRFLYAPRDWTCTVPVKHVSVEHIFMPQIGGKSSFINIAISIFNNVVGTSLPFLGRGFNEYFKHAEWADFVIFSPCGANIGIYQDWSALKFLIYLTTIGKMTLFHLNTINKSNSFLFDLLAKYVLRRNIVFVRELMCKETLSKWGVSSYFGPDTAFALPSIEPAEGSNKIKTITFIPTDLSWHPEHKGFKLEGCLIQEIANFALENNLQISLLPHLYGNSDEAFLLAEIKDRFAKHGVKENMLMVNSKVSSALDYDKAIADSYLVVTMRYHGVVLSCKNGVPFLALSYENKMNEVCKYAASEKYCVNYKELQAGQIHTNLKLINQDYDNIKKQLQRESKILSKMAYYPLSEFLKTHPDQ